MNLARMAAPTVRVERDTAMGSKPGLGIPAAYCDD
jgi:hypothetical protein